MKFLRRHFFYYAVLALALFIGVYASITGHWITFIGAGLVVLYFVVNPYELD